MGIARFGNTRQGWKRRAAAGSGRNCPRRAQSARSRWAWDALRISVNSAVLSSAEYAARLKFNGPRQDGTSQKNCDFSFAGPSLSGRVETVAKPTNISSPVAAPNAPSVPIFWSCYPPI